MTSSGFSSYLPSFLCWFFFLYWVFPQVSSFILFALLEARPWLLRLRRRTLCSDRGMFTAHISSLSSRLLNPAASLPSLLELTEMKPLPPRGIRAQNRNTGTETEGFACPNGIRTDSTGYFRSAFSNSLISLTLPTHWPTPVSHFTHLSSLFSTYLGQFPTWASACVTSYLPFANEGPPPLHPLSFTCSLYLGFPSMSMKVPQPESLFLWPPIQLPLLPFYHSLSQPNFMKISLFLPSLFLHRPHLSLPQLFLLPSICWNYSWQRQHSLPCLIQQSSVLLWPLWSICHYWPVLDPPSLAVFLMVLFHKWFWVAHRVIASPGTALSSTFTNSYL